MPLQLINPDSIADLRKRVVFDPDSAQDVLEAQTKVEQLRSQGFVVWSSEPGEMVLAPPARSPDHVLMRVLDDNGDTRLLWNRRNQPEVDEARAKFNEYLTKGYRAYVCRSDGAKGRKVDTFDALLEEVILLTSTEATRRDAAQGWRQPEAILVPPTQPG